MGMRSIKTKIGGFPGDTRYRIRDTNNRSVVSRIAYPVSLSVARDPHPLQRRHRSDPLLGESIGCLERRNLVARSNGENTQDGVVDLLRLALGAVHRPALQFAEDV